MPTALQLWNLSPAPGSCPYAQRAWIALVEKNIHFEILLASKDDKPQEFQQLYEAVWPESQAKAKVPTLTDRDGTQLTESHVVVEYLEAKYKSSGTQLLPDDPALAAKARLFVEFFNTCFTARFFKLCRVGGKTEVAEASTALLQGIGGIDAFLKTHGTGMPFLLGSQYSFAEVMTASFLWRAQVTLLAYRDMDLLNKAETAGLSRFITWAQAVLERPSTQQTNLPAEVWVDVVKPQVKDLVT